jgi:protein-disulfide isomerase
MIKSKYILLGASTLAALYGVSYMMKLNRFSQELETVTKASIYKVSLQGIELRIDVALKNPSGGSVRVKQPFVKLIYNNATVASSQIENVNVTVPKFSEVNMEPIQINIGFLTLAAKFPALLKEYRDTGQINLVVKTITTINDKLPYTSTENITLGGGKKA